MQIHNYAISDTFLVSDFTKVNNFFDRVERGQNEDYRTPFFNEAARDEILSNWYDQMEYLLAKEHISIPGLLDFEEEMKSKVGPLSVMKPLSERMEDIEAYYKLINAKSIPIDSKAILSFITSIKGIKITPYNFEETINNMRLSTNSGIPFFTRRNKVVYQTKVILNQGQYYIAILGWRGQEGGPDVEDVKQRVVWMFPLAVNVRELSVYTPLIKAWQANNINSAYIGNTAVEMKITKCFDTKGDDYVVGTDFSKFDQHFNYDLQNAAEQCLNYMLPDQKGKEWLREVFPIKYEIPIAISANKMLTGKHGMGSGSGGTNFDECCAHSCLQHEVAIHHGQVLNPYSNAYGDDGYLTYPGIKVEDVIESYTSHGQEMNVDKQFVSKDSAIYLRRYFHMSYRNNKSIMLGIYSTCRALGRLMGQERFYRYEKEVDYAKYLTLRAWSIIENCNNHPLFDEFVKYVIKGDKYKLGLDIPGFIDGFESDFDKLRELDPDVLGYTKTLQSEHTGVKEWRDRKSVV